MIWDRITDPHKRMNKAREKLFTTREAQFWGTLGLTMGIIPDAIAAPGTMATDGVNIYYDPDYVMTLPLEECMGVIAHEISHPALGHFARQGTRDTETWNIAADYELNLDLAKAGLKLPSTALLDARFDGLSAEQIFNVVSRENKENEKRGGQPRHKPASGNMLHPTDPDTGLPMSGDQLAKLADQWQEKTAQALGAARKAGYMAGGHIPTSLVAVTDKIRQTSLVDWRQPLREFIDVLGSRHSTWSKLSRRGLTRGAYLPGQQVVRPSLVGFFIDVSGSMDSDKVRQALVEAQSALDDMACDAIDVVYTDTTVKAVDHYETGDTIVFKDGTGGGTDFKAAMAYAADVDTPYAAIVFITDGQTNSFGQEPDCPVLWAITDTLPNTERLKTPYGEKLCLYTS